MSLPTATVRIWKGLHEILRDLSDEYGYVMSDLASAILLEALQNEAIVFSALVEWFDVDIEEARETARKVSQLVRTIVRIEEEAEEDVEEAEITR